VRHVLVTVPLWAAVTEPMPGRGSPANGTHAESFVAPRAPSARDVSASAGQGDS
jgi:hypothetical protein